MKFGKIAFLLTVCSMCFSDLFVSSVIGATVINCAAGKYLPKGKTVCAYCLAGSYCPGGLYPTGNSDNQGIVKCPAGKYSNKKGATSENTCQSCSAGTYSAAGATSCTPCPTGTYSGTEGATSCTACPAEKPYTSETGSTDESACASVAIGQCSDSGTIKNCVGMVCNKAGMDCYGTTKCTGYREYLPKGSSASACLTCGSGLKGAQISAEDDNQDYVGGNSICVPVEFYWCYDSNCETSHWQWPDFMTISDLKATPEKIN